MLPRRGDYGFDAPYVPAMLVLGALPLLYGGIANAVAGHVGGALSMGLSGAFMAACAASYVYTTRAGKFACWDALLDGLALRGDETLLDLGCGRGAVLLLGAQRLPRGKVIGVDLWSKADQSGNARGATLENARREGVDAARVELHTGDMRELPLPDASADVVVSSLAIHNISDRDGRRRAVQEAARVLAPGGRLAIADIRFVGDYAETLRAGGLGDVAVRGLGPRFWYGGPWMATKVVTARKPGAS